MKKENHIYVFSALAILSAVGAYFWITKKSDSGAQNEVDAPPANDVTTTTGSVITQDQFVLPAELNEVLQQPITEIAKKLGNKNIYTKVENVMARKSPAVNNGIINNRWGAISATGTLIGKITAVAEDNNRQKNANGRVYRWFKVNLSNDAKNSINDMQLGGTIISKLSLSKTYVAYVREDTVKFQ